MNHFAPCGAVAGILARTDETSPVWAPTKPEEPVLRPGYRPTCLVAEDRRRRLAFFGVNTLQAVRSVARIGVKPRTLAAGAAGAQDWQSLAARRLALFIVNSIERGTRWLVSAGPHVDIADVVTTEVRIFFEELYDAGAFAGRLRAEAFFVICNRRMVSGDADHAEFHFLIGFAAGRRGEFHSYRIAHGASGSKVQRVTLNRASLAEYHPEELEWVDRLAQQLVPSAPDGSIREP
jgi:phage tail sheath protein FI